MVHVIHTKCGEQMGWFLLDEPRSPDFFCSDDFRRMDGSTPYKNGVLYEKCPKCGELITRVFQMKRVFEKQEAA